MSRCECNIEVNNNSNCPLCGKHANDGPRAKLYPTYYISREVHARKILLFTFFCAGLICLFLDIVISFNGWSIIACAGLFLLWFALFKPIFDKSAFAVVVTYCALLAYLCIVVLELFATSGYRGWASSYVMPGIVALGITLILFAASIKKTVKWSEIEVYIITLALMNAMVVVLWAVNIAPSILLCLIVQLYSFLCLFGMRVFLGKRFSEGIKKQMHV